MTDAEGKRGGAVARAEARVGRLIATNAGTLAAAGVILFVLTRVRILLSGLAFALLIGALAVILAAEVGLWLWRGIRVLEVDADGLRLTRGVRRSTSWIGREQIRGVRLTRRIGRGRIVVALSYELRLLRLAIPLPWRLVIPEDAFGDEDFLLLSTELDRLNAWNGP